MQGTPESGQVLIVHDLQDMTVQGFPLTEMLLDAGSIHGVLPI
jgi:hypothetical protein